MKWNLQCSVDMDVDIYCVMPTFCAMAEMQSCENAGYIGFDLQYIEIVIIRKFVKILCFDYTQLTGNILFNDKILSLNCWESKRTLIKCVLWLSIRYSSVWSIWKHGWYNRFLKLSLSRYGMQSYLEIKIIWFYWYTAYRMGIKQARYHKSRRRSSLHIASRIWKSNYHLFELLFLTSFRYLMSKGV